MTTSTASDHTATVQAFYLAFYGRPADPDGLAFWSVQLAASGGQLGAIAGAFAQSQEAVFRFGDAPPAQRIAEVYATLYGRAPEPEGLRYWTDAVDQGHVSLAEVAIAILQGAQGSDRDLAGLRLEAASRFTAQVEPGPSDYHGYAAIEAGRVLLRAVGPGASAEQIDALVTSALAFANVVSDFPGVMQALAPAKPLLGLFDSGRHAHAVAQGRRGRAARRPVAPDRPANPDRHGQERRPGRRARPGLSASGAAAGTRARTGTRAGARPPRAWIPSASAPTTAIWPSASTSRSAWSSMKTCRPPPVPAWS